MNWLAVISFISSSLFLLHGLFVFTEGIKKRKPFIWLALFFGALGLNFLNIYIGIAIHCSMNILGALRAYYAVLNGVLVGR